MNQLKRIILINSGTVDFYELQLDGNIHFIGTQGTGKSTLLRAILFFYNADARKLGISKEKIPFSDYYFPHADSYIVYEVSQENRNFCVWLYKKQNRLCFRFIDGSYERDIFIDKQQACSESQIIEKANQHGYKVHHPIYNFTEYRDIIYGANKSLSRFSLHQNSSYQNIPRTISNIFLNSSLDGGFIKTTIINSLSDDSFEINLDTNRHHIETARNDYRDVSEYLNREKKAQKIVSLYDELLLMEDNKKELSWEIGATYNQAKEMERNLEEEHKLLTQQCKVQEDIISRVNADFSQNQRKVQDKLSIVKRDISKATQLIRDYTAKNIDLIVAEASKKGDYQSQQSQIQVQLNLLTSDLKDIEIQYSLNKQSLETQCQQQIVDFERSNMVSKEKLNQDLANLSNVFYQQKEQITADHNSKLTKQNQDKAVIEGKIKEVGFKIENIQNRSYFQEEIEALKLKQQELTRKSQDLAEQKSITLIQKESAIATGEQELKLLELQTSQENEKLGNKKKLLDTEINNIQAELQSLAGSLLEFLEQNRPDWGMSIGKVVSRDLLLQNDLQPSKTSGDNLYGIILSLDQRQPIQLSKSGMEANLHSLIKQLEEHTNIIQNFQKDTQDQKDKHQKKYNKKISELNQAIKENTYQEEKIAIDLEKCLIALKEVNEKAEIRKRHELEEIEHVKYQLLAELKQFNEYIGQLEDRYRKTIGDLETQRKSKEKNIKSQLKDLDDRIAEGKKSIQERFGDQIKKLDEQRNIRLKEKGLDVSAIHSLEGQLNKINDLLKEIDNNNKLLIEYDKDKRDYIDRLEEFRQERKSLENELDHLQQLYTNRIKKENAELNRLKELSLQATNNLKELKHQLDAYDRFSKSQLFDDLRSYVEHHDISDRWNCDENIDKLKNLALEYEKNDKSFTERITEFSGYFNPQNCLGFDTNSSGNLQFRSFAENLKEFVREQKIIDFKTEVTRKYAMVLTNIVNETNDMLQKEDEVNKVVQRINTDFKKSNFVGVVKSIEMRIQESSNKVIQLLRKIRKFQNDNGYSYGEINLFNQGNSSEKDHEAVKLLESLLSQIGQAKTKVMSLEDAFDLEFRIRENENDTNWVSRLANVGSNGTDVLVKSMIYINLLHIFKSNGAKTKTDTILHCLIDEVGILHDSNVNRLINFASERNIRLINGSPNSHNEQDYKHIYMFRKNPKTNKTGITKLISNEL